MGIVLVTIAEYDAAGGAWRENHKASHPGSGSA
jgi:hypothetical protein